MLALLLPVTGLARSAGPPPPQELSEAEVQKLVAEFRDLDRQFRRLQAQAVAQNEALQAREKALNTMIDAAIAELHPEAKAHMARIDEIEVEAFKATMAGKEDLADELMAEGKRLHAGIEAAEQQVMEQDPVQRAVQRFEDEMLKVMSAIDPEAPRILERREALSKRLRARTR